MILQGDCLDVLKTLDAESIDAGVTDPPYGIGFMGREWDTFKPGSGRARKLMHPREREAAKIVSENPNINGRWRSPALSPSQIDYDYSAAGLRRFQEWTAQWATEVHRVLKPGAYLVVCGAPRAHHRMMCGLEDAGFVIRDCFAWLFGSGFPKNTNLGEGRGTALKPAHEPIALAWKPFKTSIKANLATHGTGALNIEACRLTTRPEPDPRDAETPELYDLGRWPANVLLDEEAAALLDEQTGELVSGGTPAFRNADKFRNTYGDFKGGASENGIGSSFGGASRFYYVAKPSREERDYGTEGLIARARDDSRKDGHPGGDNPRNRGLQPARKLSSDRETDRVDALARPTRDTARRNRARSVHGLWHDGHGLPLRAAGVRRHRAGGGLHRHRRAPDRRRRAALWRERMDSIDGIVVGVLLVAVVILAAMWIREGPAEREYDRQMKACIKYANEHVWADGKTVADDVDPIAWCQP